METTTKAIKVKIKPGTEAELSVQAEKHMNEPTRAISDQWAKMIGQANAMSLSYQYQQALDVSKVIKDQGLYGMDAAQQLFRRHGMAEKYLNDYKNVGDRISKTEFRRIELINKDAPAERRVPITFSHLVKAARLVDRKDRENLLLRVAEEGWSTATLGEEVTKLIDANPEAAASNKAGKGIRANVAIANICQSAEKFVKATDLLIDDTFMERLESVKVADLQKFIDRTQEAKNMLIQLKDNFEAKLTTLEASEQYAKNRLEELERRAERRSDSGQDKSAKPAKPKATKSTKQVAEGQPSAKTAGKSTSQAGVRRKKKVKKRRSPVEVADPAS